MKRLLMAVKMLENQRKVLIQEEGHLGIQIEQEVSFEEDWLLAVEVKYCLIGQTVVWVNVAVEM